MGPSAKREALSRPTIIDAAISVADHDGVGALTMRKLAERLGYKVMALYTHVANKDELLSAMVDAVTAEIDGPEPEVEPLTALRAMAVSTRSVFLAHPWAAELWAKCMPGPTRTLFMETLLRVLDQSGLRPDLAHHGFHAIQNHVVGYTLQELDLTRVIAESEHPTALATDYLDGLSPDTHPYTIAHVHQHLDGDTASSFELVLDLILDGLVRLNET